MIGKVVDKFVMELESQLSDRQVAIELTEEARSWLGRKGYDRLYGARPLGRIIQENIKQPLAEELLFGNLTKGGLVVVDRDKKADKLVFRFEDGQAEDQTAAQIRRQVRREV